MTLVPFIDMINHSSNENVSVSRVENALEIRSTRSIEENDEITFSYHSESSRFWICEYGFWLDNNKYDDLDLTNEIQSVVTSQMEWLEQEGYWGLHPSEYKLIGGNIRFRWKVKYRFEFKWHYDRFWFRKSISYGILWRERVMERKNKVQWI